MTTEDLIKRLKVFSPHAKVGIIGKIVERDGTDRVDWFEMNDQDVWLYQGRVAIEGVKDVVKG